MMLTWWTTTEDTAVAEERTPADCWLERHPPHPGETIRYDCLGALGVGEAARLLGVSRESLAEVLQGRSPVTAALALSLEAQGWSNAEFWLRCQAHYDLARERLRQARHAA